MCRRYPGLGWARRHAAAAATAATCCCYLRCAQLAATAHSCARVHAFPPLPLQAALALSASGSGLPPPHDFTFYCEPRHDELPPPTASDQPASQQQQQRGGGGSAAAGPAGAAQAASAGALALASSSCSSGGGEGLVSKWRQKERLKTTAVALVMCLNIGAARAAGVGRGLSPSSGGRSTAEGCSHVPRCHPASRRGPSRCHQNQPLRAARVLGGPSVHAGPQSPGHHW